MAFIRLVGEFGSHRMHTTMIYLSTNELLIATRTLKLLEPSKHLPENVLPAYRLLSEEHHELVDVPMLIALMF